MLRLYDYRESGNAYKVRLLLSQLGIPYERVETELADRVERGYEALGVMERHLHGREFFVGARYSVADIALYAFTHVAHEGGFDLENYPSVNAWLERVGDQPGHVSIGD